MMIFDLSANGFLLKLSDIFLMNGHEIVLFLKNK